MLDYNWDNFHIILMTYYWTYDDMSVGKWGKMSKLKDNRTNTEILLTNGGFREDNRTNIRRNIHASLKKTTP